MSDAKHIALDIYKAIATVSRNDKYEEYRQEQFLKQVTPIIEDALRAQVEALTAENERLREAADKVVSAFSNTLTPEKQWLNFFSAIHELAAALQPPQKGDESNG